MNKTLRAIALPFALFFTLSTATAPARAVLPLIAGGVALMTEGSMAANGLAALTVGAVAGVIYLGNLQNGQGTEAGSFMEIPLGTSRDRPLSTPPNYTPPANNNSQPVPPSSISQTFMWQTGQSGATPIHASATAACNAWFGSAVVYVVEADTNAACRDGQYNLIGAVYKVAVCSAGYSVSGSSCTLTNAAVVQKPADGRCQILASVSGFTVDPQDPECSGLAAQTGTSVAPNKISQTKPGTLTNGSVTINPDGSRTIVYSYGNTINNTTTTTTVNMVPAAGGQNAQVTGSSVTVVNGTGNLAAPAVPTIEFPDDYNREVTQEQIKTGIETLHGDLDSTAFAQPAAPVETPSALSLAENKKITDALDASVASYDNFKLLDWSTWIPVLPASSCSPFTGSVMGRPVSIDICPKVAMLNELIGWLLAVYATWSVVMMAFRKN